MSGRGSTKKVSTTKAATATLAPAPAPESEPATSAPAPVEPAIVDVTMEAESDLYSQAADELDELVGEVGKLATRLKGFKSKLRDLGKVYRKELRKKQRRGVTKGEVPVGFSRPVPISAEMAAFLGYDASGGAVEVPRTEVTKAISAYVGANNLKCEDNKRNVALDSRLAALTGQAAGTVINLFGIQGHLKHHFVKAAAA